MISSLEEEYETIVELGADLIGVSADSLESHAAFCGALGRCPFPLLPVTRTSLSHGPTGRSQRTVVAASGLLISIVDADLTVIHKIPWYRPGNVGQLMEIFQALGVE